MRTILATCALLLLGVGAASAQADSTAAVPLPVGARVRYQGMTDTTWIPGNMIYVGDCHAVAPAAQLDSVKAGLGASRGFLATTITAIRRMEAQGADNAWITVPDAQLAEMRCKVIH